MYPWAAGVFGGGGANMAFDTEMLRQAGGFDPALGAGTTARGGEDLAIFVELVIRGFQLVYEPGAIIYHTNKSDYPSLRQELYSYGVGLTAYLTKCILDRPGRLVDILLKLPYALVYVFSARSGKNKRKDAVYPADLSRAELHGMVYGPLAYVRSRWLAAAKG